MISSMNYIAIAFGVSFNVLFNSLLILAQKIPKMSSRVHTIALLVAAFSLLWSLPIATLHFVYLMLPETYFYLQTLLHIFNLLDILSYFAIKLLCVRQLALFYSKYNVFWILVLLTMPILSLLKTNQAYIRWTFSSLYTLSFNSFQKSSVSFAYSVNHNLF
ncbi:hypothetical protein BC833DRAFT_577969 [Globomyces pollinis-pini]|nr:hypothetical protein BC833DRAFT_577969 [Globomyces pollinis-pini]